MGKSSKLVCPECQQKTDKNFPYCPNCGTLVSRNKEDELAPSDPVTTPTTNLKPRTLWFPNLDFDLKQELVWAFVAVALILIFVFIAKSYILGGGSSDNPITPINQARPPKVEENSTILSPSLLNLEGRKQTKVLNITAVKLLVQTETPFEDVNLNRARDTANCDRNSRTGICTDYRPKMGYTHIEQGIPAGADLFYRVSSTHPVDITILDSPGSCPNGNPENEQWDIALYKNHLMREKKGVKEDHFEFKPFNKEETSGFCIRIEADPPFRDAYDGKQRSLIFELGIRYLVETSQDSVKETEEKFLVNGWATSFEGEGVIELPWKSIYVDRRPTAKKFGFPNENPNEQTIPNGLIPISYTETPDGDTNNNLPPIQPQNIPAVPAQRQPCSSLSINKDLLGNHNYDAFVRAPLRLYSSIGINVVSKRCIINLKEGVVQDIIESGNPADVEIVMNSDTFNSCIAAIKSQSSTEGEKCFQGLTTNPSTEKRRICLTAKSQFDWVTQQLIDFKGICN